MEPSNEYVYLLDLNHQINEKLYNYYICIQKKDHLTSYECNKINNFNVVKDLYSKINSFDDVIYDVPGKKYDNILYRRKCSVIPVLKMPQSVQNIYLNSSLKKKMVQIDSCN